MRTSTTKKVVKFEYTNFGCDTRSNADFYNNKWVPANISVEVVIPAQMRTSTTVSSKAVIDHFEL